VNGGTWLSLREPGSATFGLMIGNGMVEPVSRRRALGLGLCAAALAGCAEPGRPSPSPPASTRVEAPPSPRPGSAAVEVVRAETGRPQVALTFHGAGDLALARQVLDRLRQRGAG
jgi:hypothetical protein